MKDFKTYFKTILKDLKVELSDEFDKNFERKAFLQHDMDDWLDYYNNERPHSGRYCYGKTPMQTFTDSKSLAEEKMLNALPLEKQIIS